MEHKNQDSKSQASNQPGFQVASIAAMAFSGVALAVSVATAAFFVASNEANSIKLDAALSNVESKVGQMSAADESPEAFAKRVEVALESIIEARQQAAQAGNSAAPQGDRAQPVNYTAPSDVDSYASLNDEGQVVFGNPDAPVSIYTFVDFRCSFCARYHDVVESTVVDSDGEVNWIYKPFPVLGQASQQLALAGECVSQIEGPEAFWRYKSLAYSTQNWSTSVSRLGLDDSSDVRNCVTNGLYQDRVNESVALGREMGVEGTPASLFRNNISQNGIFTSGLMQPAQMQEILQEISK